MTQLIPGDYEARNGLPGPHEPVCPKRRRDPQYQYLFNPCGRALGHEGECSPMTSIQKQRRSNQSLAEAFKQRREVHKLHDQYFDWCVDCRAEKEDAEFAEAR